MVNTWTLLKSLENRIKWEHLLWWYSQTERGAILNVNIHITLLLCGNWKRHLQETGNCIVNVTHVPPSKKLQTLSSRLDTKWNVSRIICCCMSSAWKYINDLENIFIFMQTTFIIWNSDATCVYLKNKYWIACEFCQRRGEEKLVE